MARSVFIGSCKNLIQTSAKLRPRLAQEYSAHVDFDLQPAADQKLALRAVLWASRGRSV